MHFKHDVLEKQCATRTITCIFPPENSHENDCKETNQVYFYRQYFKGIKTERNGFLAGADGRVSLLIFDKKI